MSPTVYEKSLRAGIFLLGCAINCLCNASPGEVTDHSVPQPDQVARQGLAALHAYAAYKSGNYNRALDLWRTLAEQGNTTAMNNLANMYEQGQGTEQDLGKAADWLRKAAEVGDHIAQLNLGLAYEKGRGVPRDNEQAAHWFRLAAEQGDRDAQFNLGIMLATAYGEGFAAATGAQKQEAGEWLAKASEGGHPDAGAFLSLLNSSSAAEN